MHYRLLIVIFFISISCSKNDIYENENYHGFAILEDGNKIEFSCFSTRNDKNQLYIYLEHRRDGMLVFNQTFGRIPKKQGIYKLHNGSRIYGDSLPYSGFSTFYFQDDARMRYFLIDENAEMENELSIDKITWGKVKGSFNATLIDRFDDKNIPGFFGLPDTLKIIDGGFSAKRIR